MDRVESSADLFCRSAALWCHPKDKPRTYKAGPRYTLRDAVSAAGNAGEIPALPTHPITRFGVQLSAFSFQLLLGGPLALG
jgi:hypothetical protein